MISLNSLRRAESKHFPTSIETLIEQDLQKLQEANQEVVDDDGNGDWQEDDSDVEEEENAEDPENAGDAEKAEGDAEKAEGDAEKAEGGAEKAEGDAENEDKEGPPGSNYQDDDEEPKDYFDDEDSDPIILGVRIYTKGGVAVSVTGHVVGEGINEDEDEDKDKKDKDKNLKKKATNEKGD